MEAGLAEVRAEEARVWHSWRPGPGPGLATLLPYYYSHYSQPQPRRWAAHCPQPPGIMTWSHQTSDDSFTRPRAWPVSSAESAECPGPFLSEAWWDYTAACGELGWCRLECRSETGPGLGLTLNTTLPLTLVTTHSSGEHSDSRDQQRSKEFFGSVKTLPWERRGELFFWIWVIWSWTWMGCELKKIVDRVGGSDHIH